MNFKTDTKEKFSVICPETGIISANMTAEMEAFILPYLQKDIPHIILKLNGVSEIDANAAECIAVMQQKFYAQNASFVICEMQAAVVSVFEKQELIDSLNYTPTESEAWDILQMEEIERELMNDFEDEEDA